MKLMKMGEYGHNLMRESPAPSGLSSAKPVEFCVATLTTEELQEVVDQAAAAGVRAKIVQATRMIGNLGNAVRRAATTLRGGKDDAVPAAAAIAPDDDLQGVVSDPAADDTK